MRHVQTRREFLRKISMLLPAAAMGGRGLLAATVKRPLPPVSLDFIDSRLELMRRVLWTGDAPKVWLLREAGYYDRLTVHHAGNHTNFHTEPNSVIHDLEGILTAHDARNYGDIGYHFIVDYAGRVWEGRSLAYEGAHVSTQNERNIGVMAMGNFERQEPSVAQISAVRQLAELLRRRYRIKRYRVYGHRDLGPSVCPGRHLYSHVLTMRREQ